MTEYRSWVESRRSGLGGLAGDRLAAAQELLLLATIASDRMERGIRLLVDDPSALDAFRTANRSVAAALSRRLGREGVSGATPRWRAFQLAFILLNLPGIADPANPEREFVDLLFFPTGGGKTEAYLGLAAFTMVLRRLRNQGDGGLAGAGVSVIMRYTLRLLTLDQLGRAAGLICALELERRQDAIRLGSEAGRSRSAFGWARPARPTTSAFKGGRTLGLRPQQGQPVQVQSARPAISHPPRELPMVRRRTSPRTPSRCSRIRIIRPISESHARTGSASSPATEPLPIVAVDEPLYRRLPAFLIATVDKFASLPWTGESGALLGGADRHDSARVLRSRGASAGATVSLTRSCRPIS